MAREAETMLAALDDRVAGSTAGLSYRDTAAIRRRLARWGPDLLADSRSIGPRIDPTACRNGSSTRSLTAWRTVDRLFAR